MDVRYINPFLTAVQNIFETMINLTYTLGKPTLKKDNVTTYEISGIIGITGEVNGCVVVSFPESVALQLASALLEDELTQRFKCCHATDDNRFIISQNACC